MSGPLSRRERLRRCYFNEELDRPAVYCRTGFPSGDPTYVDLKAYLKVNTELKRGWSGTQFETAPVCDIHKEHYSEDFERRIEILHTPKGGLRRTFLDGLRHHPGMHETFYINSAEDAEKYLSLPLPEISGDVTSFFEADKAIGETGIVDVGLGFNPAGFVAELCGSVNFAILSTSDRELLYRLCERQMNIILQRIEFLFDAGVGPFFSMLGEEYIVPPLHSPKDFRDFNVRYDKPIIDLIHERGGRIHIHCHGSMKNIMQGFIDMGADVLHPFEPPPQGDILAREAKLLARGKMCLEGNIQIHRMYEATPEEIHQETEQLIADAFDDNRGLIVCPTASPYIPGAGEKCFPQFKAMVETVLR